MIDLDALLTRLASQTDTALQKWALREGVELTDEGAWLSLEHNPYVASPYWDCGWRISSDGADEWIIHAIGPTPTVAAFELERML